MSSSGALGTSTARDSSSARRRSKPASRRGRETTPCDASARRSCAAISRSRAPRSSAATTQRFTTMGSSVFAPSAGAGVSAGARRESGEAEDPPPWCARCRERIVQPGRPRSSRRLVSTSSRTPWVKYSRTRPSHSRLKSARSPPGGDKGGDDMALGGGRSARTNISHRVGGVRARGEGRRSRTRTRARRDAARLSEARSPRPHAWRRGGVRPRRRDESVREGRRPAAPTPRVVDGVTDRTR